MIKIDYITNLVSKINADSSKFVGSFGVYPKQENSFVAVMPERMDFFSLSSTSAPEDYYVTVHIVNRFRDYTDTSAKIQSVLDYYNNTLFEHLEGHNITSGRFITVAVNNGLAVGIEVELKIAAGVM